MEYLSVFSLNTGKYGPEESPHRETFSRSDNAKDSQNKSLHTLKP